jgi:hypothetical protein
MPILARNVRQHDDSVPGFRLLGLPPLVADAKPSFFPQTTQTVDEEDESEGRFPRKYLKEPNLFLALRYMRSVFDKLLAQDFESDAVTKPLSDVQVRDFLKFQGYGDWRFSLLLRMKGYQMINKRVVIDQTPEICLLLRNIIQRFRSPNFGT